MKTYAPAALSARAIPAGVAALRFNQREPLNNGKLHKYLCFILKISINYITYEI